MPKFNGDNITIYADGVAVGHSVDGTLTTNQDLPDTTTKGSNSWTDNLYGNRSWEVSGSGLVAFDSSKSVVDIIDYILNASDVSVEFSSSESNTREFSGTVSVSASSFTASQNSPSGFDFSFTGNGVLSPWTIFYQSDFSSGVEGWQILNNITALDGNIDGILGEDNTLRATCGADGQNRIWEFDVIQDLVEQRVTGKVYVPSSQSDVTGYRFTISGTPIIENLTGNGSWLTFDTGTFTPNGAGTAIIVNMTNTSGVNIVGGSGDLMYIKDILVRHKL